MTDIIDCGDLTSLQTLVFLIMYLQCSAKLPTCYTYLGIAIKGAVRMGLHRHTSPTSCLIEREVRRRIFWVLRKMDIHVSAMLGLPGSIADDDIDQELPLDIDDKTIHKTCIPLEPSQLFTDMTATLAHVRLMGILKQIITHVYCIKSIEQIRRRRRRVYFVDQTRIHGIEICLREWCDSLSVQLKAPTSNSERLTRHGAPRLLVVCVLTLRRH